MTKTTKRIHASSNHCDCCMHCCIPVLGVMITLEQIIKGFCCLPCYIDCNKDTDENNKISSIINEDLQNRYTGTVWGIRR